VRLLIRWAITAVALFVAATIVPGIEVEPGGWPVFAVMAIILALVNALVRPILALLSCPLILATFGLFTFVVNAVAFWIASGLAQRWFDVGFHVDGFLAALLGSIVVSIVSTILTVFLPDEDRK
jgi:putative membrane protein